jgi:pre-mRNA-processing factor SLU7
LGARWTNNNIQADELIQEVNLDYEGKHDRWNGYDTNRHMSLVQRYHQIEEERKKKRADDLKRVAEEKKRQKEQKEKQEQKNDDNNKSEQTNGGTGENGRQSESESKREKEKEEQQQKRVNEEPDSDDDSDADEDLDEHGAQMQKFHGKTRTTIRNLRIREDTAKYLRNLDVNSAYYDPKTRSMRANPNPEQAVEDAVFAGDNFLRSQGTRELCTAVVIVVLCCAYERERLRD